MMLYRYRIKTILLVILSTAFFTSCIRDKFEDALKNSNFNKTPYFLSVKAKDSGGSSLTRAEEGESQENGEKEHEVGEEGNFVIFFNKDKSLFGIYPLELLGHTEGEGNKEAIYTARFYPEDGELPASCLIVLNGGKISEKFEEYKNKKGTPVDTILTKFWSADEEENNDPRTIGIDANKHFTLTNSMYFDKDGNLQAPIKIPETALAKSQAEAKKNAMTVYVERMVAKFSFDFDEEKEQPKNIFQPSTSPDLMFFLGYKDGAPEFDKRRWRIEVTGWGINALETKTHIFKNITLSKDGENGYLKDWNDPDNFRSYWSEDPHYDKTDYPWQYRQGRDSYVPGHYEENIAEKDTNMLRNYSFEDLGLFMPDNGDFDLSNAFGEKIIYSPENTYDAAIVKPHLDSRAELLAGTHLLVGARLQIEVPNSQSESTEIDGAQPNSSANYKPIDDLYRDRNGFYYEKERLCIAALVHDINQTLTSQNTMRFYNYDWGGGEDKQLVNKELIADTEGEYSLFYKKDNNDWEKLTEEKILKPDPNDRLSDDNFIKMAIATLRKGDGKRLPWIDELMKNGRLMIAKSDQPDQELKIYEPTTNDSPETTSNEIKSLLYEWLGAIDHFNNGKMYYACGIGATEDESKHFGVVRNNYYQFTLKDIKSLGTPVDDDGQAIVPERAGTNDGINIKISILNWCHKDTNAPILPW